MTVEDDFFDEQSEQSRIKTSIVTQYFGGWANIITRDQRRRGRVPSVRYVEPMSGPGRYKDGAASTPIKILEAAIANSSYAAGLQTFFNDKDFSDELDRNISQIPGIDRLGFKPTITNHDLLQTSLGSFVNIANPVPPTLYFVDPWGYKVLSRQFISELIEPFGCDCLFFFNIKRVNAAFGDPLKRSRIDAIFGEVIAGDLAQALAWAKSPHDRYRLIMDGLQKALTGLTANYTADFLIRDQHRNASHFLVLVSKSPKAFELAKKIFSKASTDPARVKEFVFDPIDHVRPQGLLIDESLEDVKQILMTTFAGQKLTFRQLYVSLGKSSNFTDSDYRAAVNELETENKIFVDPPSDRRRSGNRITCGPDVQITFPGQ